MPAAKASSESTHPSAPITFRFFLLFVILSIIADIASILLDVAWGKNGFLEKLNWSLYPIFFVAVGLLVYQSWALFIKAWSNIHSHSLLYSKDKVVSDDSAIAPLIYKFESSRKYLLMFSLVVGLSISALDAGCLWTEYGIIQDDSPSTAAMCKERDFTVAFTMAEPDQDFPGAKKFSNGMFTIYVYLLQGVLIAAGFLALLQMILHTGSLLFFERISEAKNKSLHIRLNIRDKYHEFGSRDFNRAINTVYVFIAIAMVIPVLSHYHQVPGTAPDFGQICLRYLLPLILFLPIALYFSDRMNRSKEISIESEGDEDGYAKQKLWPFDQTQIGYIGKMMAGFAVAEYGYIAGVSLKIF